MNECEKFLEENIDKNIWNYTIQSQKVYIIPKHITKSNAIKYLKDKLKQKKVIAAGDGKMDQDMLEMADYAILPMHGELYTIHNFTRDNLYYVDKGIFSADEIIKNVRIFIKER